MMFGKLESILNSALGLSTTPNTFTRRSFLYATGISALAAACSGSGGGSGNNDTTPSDTTPPAATDIYAYESNEHGELVDLVWQSPGDDNLEGTPSYFLIKYSADPILTEEAWDKASDLGSIDAVGPVGTNYDETLPCPAGEWYFGIKTFDEAGNASEVSDYPQGTPVKVPTREEFYVDKWLAPGGFDLNYDESVLLIRGDASKGIDYNADALAQILINTDASSGTPWSDFATWEDIRDLLLQYTDGQPVTAENSELLETSSNATTLNSNMLYNCLIKIWDPVEEEEELRNQEFKNMTQSEWDAVYDIHRNALIQIVEAFPENYGGTPGGDPDINFAPGW